MRRSDACGRLIDFGLRAAARAPGRRSEEILLATGFLGTMSGMFIVAVTRWGPGLDQQLPELAKTLGLFAYDLRMRLSGPLPVVVARMAKRDDASRLMAQLRGWGHGAVGCEQGSVFDAASMHQPREFAFEGSLLRTEDAMHSRSEVAADEVYALIHAMVLADHQQNQTRSGKQFSAARAVLSGGLVMTRKTSSSSHVTESESEERVYLIRRGFADPILFRQHQLHYAGLGEQLGRSSHENFATLVERLRQFCPGALYSAQLRETRRKNSFVGATTVESGSATTSTVTSSNASEVDLAAYLILVAHARGQL